MTIGWNKVKIGLTKKLINFHKGCSQHITVPDNLRNFKKNI